MEDLFIKIDVDSSIQWRLASPNQGRFLAQMTFMLESLMKILHKQI